MLLGHRPHLKEKGTRKQEAYRGANVGQWFSKCGPHILQPPALTYGMRNSRQGPVCLSPPSKVETLKFEHRQIRIITLLDLL